VFDDKISIRWILTICFLLSGLCALVYEVLWVRLFTLVIGNTVFSVSTVLSVFMAGLALGSYLFGRRVDRLPTTRHILTMYGLLELGIGVYAVLLPFLTTVCKPIFAHFYKAEVTSFFALGIAKWAGGFLLMIVPTTLMGGTLPVLGKFFCGERFEQFGSEVGRLYAINTFGAAIGSFAAGFVLIPWLGARTSLWTTAVMNIALALVILRLARGFPAPSPSSEPGGAVSRPRFVSRWRIGLWRGLLRQKVLLLVIFLSGFAALLYEVAWTRVLSLVLGPTVYAFSLMLTTFIVALALGSYLLSKLMKRWAERFSRSERFFFLLAGIEVLVGLSAWLILPLLGRLPLVVGDLVRRYADDFTRLQLIQCSLIFCLLLVPMVLLGMTVPLVSKLYVRERKTLGEELGHVYAANTIGAIVGSLLAGFLLIPLVGTERAILIGVVTNLLIGVIVLLANHDRSRASWSFAGLLLIVAPLAYWLSPRWDPELLSAGVYKYAPYFEKTDLEMLLKRGELVYYKEGVSATVSVRRRGGELTLALDGKVDAGDSGGDMTTQKLLAHLPLVLADAPRRVCIIGLGSGVTLAAALKHPLDRVDMVEISPEVVETARFFEHANKHALDDRRTQLIISDGRNHLLLVKQTYDVIISEPSNPWMAGVSALFTREFFQIAKSKLTEKGILCQWFHSYNMASRDLKSVLKTFQQVFPRSVLWALNENDLLLLGFKDETFDVDRRRIEANFSRTAVSEDLKQIAVFDLYSLLSLYVMEGDDLKRFADGAPVNTDDHPVLEFSSPRYMHAQTSVPNHEELMRFPKAVAQPKTFADVIGRADWQNYQNKGRMYEFAESYADAFREYKKAAEQNPRASDALDGLRRTATGDEQRAEVERIYEDLLEADWQNLEARIALAAVYEERRAYRDCIQQLRGIAGRDATNVRALEQLAACYEGAGDDDSLAATSDLLLKVNPRHSAALFYLAMIKYRHGDHSQAVELARQGVSADPQNIRARNLLAISLAQLGHVSQAQAAFEEAVQTRPGESFTYYNYGRFCLDNGWFDQAIEKFKKTIDVEALHVNAYVGIAEAYWRKREKKPAREWAERALRLDPNNESASRILSALSQN
jgi:spermidine synthase